MGVWHEGKIFAPSTIMFRQLVLRFQSKATLPLNQAIFIRLHQPAGLPGVPVLRNFPNGREGHYL